MVFGDELAGSEPSGYDAWLRRQEELDGKDEDSEYRDLAGDEFSAQSPGSRRREKMSMQDLNVVPQDYEVLREMIVSRNYTVEDLMEAVTAIYQDYGLTLAKKAATSFGISPELRHQLGQLMASIEAEAEAAEAAVECFDNGQFVSLAKKVASLEATLEEIRGLAAAA